MGNTCRGKVKTKEFEAVSEPTFKARSALDGESLGDGEVSPVIRWEQRQQELNEEVMEKMRDEFTHRPDNFILNLLVASVQFYANYDKEKIEIRKYIRDRELAFDRKLEQSKRKVIFNGGHEEISGTHVLYQPRGEPYMEMPTPLQFYIVHDNVDLYPEFEYEELQKRHYADLDGPGYRFCSEYSKRHPGYVRLRCVDIIPGVTRSNTYEDIYGFLRPLDESEFDPMVDPRPLRRSSLTNGSLLGHPTHYSDFEESDDEEARKRSPTLNGPRMANGAIPNLKQRRSSGLLPNGYPNGGQLGQLITAMRALAKDNEGGDELPNGDVGEGERPRRRSLSERRPSGLFPRVGPEMKRLRLTSSNADATDSRAMAARRLTLVEEEGEEDEEEDSDEEENMEEESNPSGPFGLNPGEALEEVKEEEEEMQVSGGEEKKKQPVILHARLNEGCFINRNIKIKDAQDAYGISTKTERRTYFSSERHMECFEEEFDDLVTVLNKEHLQDTSQRQGVAVTANELMIEEIGPKFYVEFIPTLLLKEWPNCAFEWKMRERKGKLDPVSKIMYKWPKDINIQEAAATGCNIVPMGHYNPREPNRVMKIEWQIQFAKAEQILLRSLGHTQMRLLLWMEYLLWDHLGDLPGIKNQHLRYILFWMCEKNFRDWQEARLGIKLKAYLKTLYNSLASESLPHYFVMACNMMENIPEKYIRQTQATVKKIKENLPIYVMHTMNRMRLASDFYPRLNVKKLFKLVTMESFGVEMLNPQLLTLTGGEDQSEDEDAFYRSDSEDEEGDLEEKRRLHQMRLERKRKVAEANKKSGINTTNNNNNNNDMPQRPSTIRLDTKIKRVKDLRAGPVLKLFGRHFLAMARASNRQRSYPQAYTYLLLARNMATLLDETANSDEARKLLKQVEELNEASRGGVRDMLGSSWKVNEQHDLVPNATPPRGSNWELGKTAPQPKPERDSMFGVNQRQTITSLQDLSPYETNAALKTPLTQQDSDAISELPLESPSSPLFAFPLPRAKVNNPAPLPVEPLSDLDEAAAPSNTDTVDHQTQNKEIIPTQSNTNETLLPIIKEESPSPSPRNSNGTLSPVLEVPTPTSPRHSNVTTTSSMKELTDILQEIDEAESIASEPEEASISETNLEDLASTSQPNPEEAKSTSQTNQNSTRTPTLEEASTTPKYPSPATPSPRASSPASPSPRPSSPASPSTPTYTPVSPSSINAPQFINLREDDSDEDDESTDF
ncbi:uncharacterized protein LOC127005656 [Eriocheir sinensis]|uniref:uncharacterized protein LOC127005656 n=1 Tax=Eriocheir sinensis TaxID=95602 RepID=UPI0021CA8B4B|nr:uncharacterized protein LOC127005656 [Eriocheir sinensis]